MAIVAHRARDRSASGNRRRLSESGRDRSASAGGMGTASTCKSGQRDRVTTGSDVAKPVDTVHFDCNSNLNLNPEKPSCEGKSKSNCKTGQYR